MAVRLTWDDSGFQTGLRRTLRVTGAPSVRFLAPNGGWIEDLHSTRPEEVEAQMRRVARSNPRLAQALPEAGGTPWDWIRERVADLTSDDVETRQRASEELARLQGALRLAVEEAARSADAEVKVRAEELQAEKPSPRPPSDNVTLGTVFEWLEKGVKPYWIRRQIQRKGWTFSLTEEDVSRLREAGATQDLIDVMLVGPVEGR